MNNRSAAFVVAFLTILVCGSLFLYSTLDCIVFEDPEILVGVEFLYTGDMSSFRRFVDKVRGYTNLVVLGLSKDMEIRYNVTLLNQACDYLYESGFCFIVQLTAIVKFYYNITDWVCMAMQKYGDRFVGVYYFDEPGGRQLDDASSRFVTSAESHAEAAEKYVYLLYVHIEPYLRTGARLLTADYGLYWFDYKAGYDVILAEFGWNQSRDIQVALCRGAAKAYGKEWGVTVTWTYMNPPHLISGEALYNDLILSYHSGAKYLIIFEYDIMGEEHFEALRKFWNYIRRNPERHGIHQGEVVYILPKDYGFGFRKGDDTIWGLWHENSNGKIWNDVTSLAAKYGSRLDIVYDEPDIMDKIRNHYSEIFLWNQSIS